MRRLSSIGQLLLWSFRDFVREPAVLFWALGFPILITLTLGQVMSKPRDWRASVAVLAEPGERESAELWLKTAPLKEKVTYVLMAPQELPRALATGQVRLGLEAPWGQRRFHYDPANQDAQLAYYRLQAAFNGTRDESEPLQVPGTRYVDFLLPG